jgi:hypothetical protein
MSTLEQQPNISNLQTLEAEVSLTKQELEDFRKLPKKEQEKQKQEKLVKLNDLQNKLDQAIQEAIKTGKLDEAKKLKEQLEKEVHDLEQQIDTTKKNEKFPTWKEIIPDPEITSAETAKAKLEARGYKLDMRLHREFLAQLDYGENLKGSYDVVSVSVGELFDDSKIHTYAEIKTKALESGLDLVPRRLAIDLRLVNYDQPSKWTFIAMDPIISTSGNGDTSMVLLYCEDTAPHLWEDVKSVSDGNEWNSEERFFFIRK